MNQKYSFSHIVSGQFNKDAIRIAKEVSQNPGKSINPLIITGYWGSGKTLLMKAIGNEYNINFNKDKIGFFYAETFVGDYKKAETENDVIAFRNSHQSHALILIDSIEYIEGIQKAQEEFIQLIDYYIKYQKQVVCTLASLANSSSKTY